MIIPPQVYKLLKSSELGSESIAATINRLKSGEISIVVAEEKQGPAREAKTEAVVPQKKEEPKIISADAQNRQNSIFSLRNKLSGKAEEKQNGDQEKIAALCEYFSPEKAKEAWNEICGLYNGQKEHLAKAMFLAELEINESEIKARVSTGVLAKTIESDIDMLQLELRRRLRNGKIKLTALVSGDVKKEQLPYTPQEKYDYMAKQNPLLAELRRKLNLDISY